MKKKQLKHLFGIKDQVVEKLNFYLNLEAKASGDKGFILCASFLLEISMANVALNGTRKLYNDLLETIDDVIKEYEKDNNGKK